MSNKAIPMSDDTREMEDVSENEPCCKSCGEPFIDHYGVECFCMALSLACEDVAFDHGGLNKKECFKKYLREAAEWLRCKNKS